MCITINDWLWTSQCQASYYYSPRNVAGHEIFSTDKLMNIGDDHFAWEAPELDYEHGTAAGTPYDGTEILWRINLNATLFMNQQIYRSIERTFEFNLIIFWKCVLEKNEAAGLKMRIVLREKFDFLLKICWWNQIPHLCGDKLLHSSYGQVWIIATRLGRRALYVCIFTQVDCIMHHIMQTKVPLTFQLSYMSVRR